MGPVNALPPRSNDRSSTRPPSHPGEALRAFAELGTALIGARETGAALDAVIADRPGWEGLGELVAKAAALANTAASDPLDHVLGGYSRFRRYTPRLLRMLDIEASPVAQPLLEAVDVLRSDGTARPTGRTRSGAGGCAPRPMLASGRRRCCSTCATPSAPATSGWRGRAATGDIRRTLLAIPVVPDADRSLPVPASPHDWLAERRFALADGLRRLAAKARAGATVGASIEDRILRVASTGRFAGGEGGGRS